MGCWQHCLERGPVGIGRSGCRVLSRSARRILQAFRPPELIAALDGAGIFRALLAAGLIDDLYLSMVPATLGGGVPVLPKDYASRRKLHLPSSAFAAQAEVPVCDKSR